MKSIILKIINKEIRIKMIENIKWKIKIMKEKWRK